MMKIQTVTDDSTFITSFVNYTNLLLLTKFIYLQTLEMDLRI